MQQAEYLGAVRQILAEHTGRAITKLRSALDSIPAKALSVAIDVMVDQGAEGFLTVRVRLQGPDLYVLNKVIRDNASLFETVMTETGLSPNLPLMEGTEFNVGDVLTDCAAEWVCEVWRQARHLANGLPVCVYSSEGYGRSLPIILQQNDA